MAFDLILRPELSAKVDGETVDRATPSRGGGGAAYVAPVVPASIRILSAVFDPDASELTVTLDAAVEGTLPTLPAAPWGVSDGANAYPLLSLISGSGTAVLVFGFDGGALPIWLWVAPGGTDLVGVDARPVADQAVPVTLAP